MTLGFKKLTITHDSSSAKLELDNLEQCEAIIIIISNGANYN